MNDAAIAFGSSAAGALMGSLSAFYLTVLQQRRDQREKRHAALLRAQYALMSQWNILKGIEKSLLAPHRESSDRFLRMPEFRSFGSPARVPFDDIAFISSSDEPNLLQEIHIAEQKFDTAVEALRLWNDWCHKLHNSADVEVRDFNLSTGAAKLAAPPQMIFYLKKYSDVIYEVTDEAIPKLKGEVQAVEAYVKRCFKGMKALKMVEKYD